MTQDNVLVLKDEFGKLIYNGEYDFHDVKDAMEEYIGCNDRVFLKDVFGIDLDKEEKDLVEYIINDRMNSPVLYNYGEVALTFREVVEKGLRTPEEMAISSDLFTEMMYEVIHDFYTIFFDDNAEKLYKDSDYYTVEKVEDKFLWRFYWDCGRSGSLDGLFVATEKEVKDAIGKEVYFGEVLGKHSDVYGTIDEGDIYKLDISPEAVKEVSVHLGTDWSGFNPLDYIRYSCEECGESMCIEDWGDNLKLRENDQYVCEDCFNEEE